jgi:hypothetical protein
MRNIFGAGNLAQKNRDQASGHIKQFARSTIRPGNAEKSLPRRARIKCAASRVLRATQQKKIRTNGLVECDDNRNRITWILFLIARYASPAEDSITG